MAVCVPNLPRRPEKTTTGESSMLSPYYDSSEERGKQARRELEIQRPSFLYGRTVLRPRSRYMWETPERRPRPQVRYPAVLLPPPTVGDVELPIDSLTGHISALSLFPEIHHLQKDTSPNEEAEGVLGIKSKEQQKPSVLSRRSYKRGFEPTTPTTPTVRQSTLNRSMAKKIKDTLWQARRTSTWASPSKESISTVDRIRPRSTIIGPGRLSKPQPETPGSNLPETRSDILQDPHSHVHRASAATEPSELFMGTGSNRRTSAWLKPRPPLKQCTRRFPTHSVYQGEWHSLLRTFEGTGRLRLPNKVEYEGQFMDGMCHGEGALVYPNGARVMGIWNRGRLIEMTYVAGNAQNYDPNGDYCSMPDRRFHREILFGLRPACRSLLTDEEPPARPVPQGCYDAGDGIFDPVTNVVYDPITITVVRVPTTTQREWIIKHCRKGWDENVGYRPDIFEEWVDGKPTTKQKKSDEDGKGGLGGSHHIKMERRLSPSIGSVEESEQEGESREEVPETEVVEEPEEPPVEETTEKLLERLEDRFLQEEYPPAFTEDVLIRAPGPKLIDDMLFPDLIEEEAVEEEEIKQSMPKEITDKMTARERKMLLKAQKMKDEMTEQQKLELAEKERLEQEARRMERERLQRLREKYTPKWPTAAKIMVPVLEESLMERQERRRKIEEAMAKEEMRRQEMEEIQQAATEAARLQREEEEEAKKYEYKEEPKEKKKKKPKEMEEKEEDGEEASPRLSLDEETRTDEYHGPWRHVAKRLVPHLRERIEGDREAAAAKWQEDLMQLLSERASTAGLEMSTTGYLGATAAPQEEERKRGSSMRIFPPGLEERARKRRAEREAREMAEAREFAAQQAKNPSVQSMATTGIKPARVGVSIATSGGSMSKKTDRGSATSRRVSISTADKVRTSPPEDDAESHHGSTSAGPMPSIKTSMVSSRGSKVVRKVTHKEEDDDDDE